jgi:hypothetical protein
MARAKRKRLPHGTYKINAIPLRNLRSGTSYYGVECLVCGEVVALFTQPEDAVGKIEVEGPGHLLAVCQHCGASRLYAPDALKLRPWP